MARRHMVVFHTGRTLHPSPEPKLLQKPPKEEVQEDEKTAKKRFAQETSPHRRH